MASDSRFRHHMMIYITNIDPSDVGKKSVWLFVKFFLFSHLMVFSDDFRFSHEYTVSCEDILKYCRRSN